MRSYSSVNQQERAEVSRRKLIRLMLNEIMIARGLGAIAEMGELYVVDRRGV